MSQPYEFEWAYTRSIAESFFKRRIPVVPYYPESRVAPSRRLEIHSAWKGLEDILSDLITHFQLKTERALEFGVEYGFSAVALSSYFDSVLGVDTFQGDRHTNILKNIYEETLQNIAPYENIRVVRSDYQSFIAGTDRSVLYDLIHVDIIHTFADTYACGLWSAKHSTCTIFHDTESFPAVKQAVREIARETGKTFYNFTEFYGLGILV